MLLADNGAGTCNGDSGGPAFVQLSDGSWRVVGVGSTAHPTSGNTCGYGSVYEQVHPLIPWVEDATRIDITPCHEADGAWSPGPDCGGFPISLLADDRTWARACGPVETSGYSETCGDPWEPPAGDETGEDSSGSETGGSSGGRTTSTGGDIPSGEEGTSGRTSSGDVASEGGGDLPAEAGNAGGCNAAKTPSPWGAAMAALWGVLGFRRRRPGANLRRPR